VFQNIDLPTWLFWMKRAVESGIARVTKGELPKAIDGSKAKKNFITHEPEPSPVDKLTEALERQSKLLEKLLARLGDEK